MVRLLTNIAHIFQAVIESSGVEGQCGQTVTATNWNSTLYIALRAVLDGTQDGTQTGMATINASVSCQGTVTNELLANVQVRVMYLKLHWSIGYYAVAV